MPTERVQTLHEEIANAASLGQGVLGALATLPVLAAMADVRDWPRLAGPLVFTATMLLVYLASSLYHALPEGRAKRIAWRVDHAAIFLFIAGSYMPFALDAPDGGRAALFALVWSVALLGAALKLAERLRERWLSIGIYVGYAALVLLASQTVLPPWGAKGSRCCCPAAWRSRPVASSSFSTTGCATATWCGT